MSKIKLLLILLVTGLSSQVIAQGSETKEIQAKNEFFKNLQNSVNLKSEIKTVKLLAEARRLYPDAVLTWYLSAKNAMYVKDYMTAYEYYLRAKEISNDMDLDYMALEIFKELGEYEQLKNTYVVILDAHPYDANIRSAYLQLLYQLKSYDEYAEAVDQTIALPMIRPSVKKSHYNHVSQLIKSGKVSTFNKEQWSKKLPLTF